MLRCDFLSRLLRTILCVFLGSLSILAVNTAKGSSADEQALKELQQFLFDPASLASFAQQTGGQAAAAHQDLSRYPPEIQKEILEIVMMIMRESKAGATRHSAAFQQGGAQAAMKSFSPEVQKRISELAKKIKTVKP
jgi:hypothetical protein